MKEIFVLEHNGLIWKLSPNGLLNGYRRDGFPEYTFNVACPPVYSLPDEQIFTAICNFAVDQGLLEQVPTYRLPGKASDHFR